jgi:hypothetical protein
MPLLVAHLAIFQLKIKMPEECTGVRDQTASKSYHLKGKARGFERGSLEEDQGGGVGGGAGGGGGGGGGFVLLVPPPIGPPPPPHKPNTNREG